MGRTLTLKARMKNLDTLDTREVEVRFGKRTDPSGNGRHATTCHLLVSEQFGRNGTTRGYYDHTTLGKDDAAKGRYNFFAGCRIAFGRVLSKMLERGEENGFVRTIRRGVQVSLSIEENKAEIEATYRKLARLVMERRTLKALQHPDPLRRAYARYNSARNEYETLAERVAKLGGIRAGYQHNVSKLVAQDEVHDTQERGDEGLPSRIADLAKGE